MGRPKREFNPGYSYHMKKESGVRMKGGRRSQNERRIFYSILEYCRRFLRRVAILLTALFTLDKPHRHNQTPVGAIRESPLQWSTEMKTAVILANYVEYGDTSELLLPDRRSK